MKNTNHSLFDKYEMIKDLGTGSSGSVTLVRHISMDQERALKKVPKASAFAESALSEARLLKSLEHPSIPRIFDFEEDDAFYYIVEEYIDGETLDSFLLHQQLISPGLFFNICEQLCNVFIYLHTQISTPIIYRDLKPEHIIVCHNKLKLIDFGVSAYVIQDGNNFNHYGNIEFSAPECFTEDTITPAADIYSLGQLLQYILTFTPDSFSHKFQHIIQKATTSDASLRYVTVAELYQEIQEIQKLTGQPHLIHKIAVLGSHRGCGSTHVAVSLTCELNILGYHGIYIDSAKSVLCHGNHDGLQIFKQKNGYYYYKSFQGIPDYSDGIQFNIPKDAIQIYDLGTDVCNEKIYDMDLVLYVCNGSFWHLNDIYRNHSIIKKMTASLSPDVILLGEMRDYETINTAVTAAETGHLIFSSLHTIGAANTIDRIIDAFPASQQHQIAIQLASVLQAVVCQKLLPATNGEMVPAFEIMVLTPAIRNLIREGKVHQIDGIIYTSAAENMIAMDTSIFNLYKAGVISKHVAISEATNPEMMSKRINLN